MVEYKTADKLPILEEVTETTYALVEDGGSLKRVSGSNLGGNSNCFVINIEQAEVSPAEASTSPTAYTCNMTYNELMEALQNKTLVGFSVNVYSGTQMYGGYVSGIYFGTDAPGIMIEYSYQNGDGTLQFSADNTISKYSNVDS